MVGQERRRTGEDTRILGELVGERSSERRLARSGISREKESSGGCQENGAISFDVTDEGERPTTYCRLHHR